MLAPRIYLAFSLPLIGIYFAFPAGGTAQSVIYELLGEEGQVSASKRQLLDFYAKALELYRHKRFGDNPIAPASSPRQPCPRICPELSNSDLL